MYVNHIFIRLFMKQIQDYNIYYDKIEQIYNLIKPCIKSIERINDGIKEV